MAPSTVVRADRADLAHLTTTLARAFADDPVFHYLAPGGFDHRRATLAFRMLGINMIEHGEVWRTVGHEAAAYWAPPGKWSVPWTSVAKTVPLSVRAYRWKIPRALAFLSRIEKVHPRDPHYYLEILGTDPSEQGRGLGASLVAPILDRADDEGVGAFLESSKDTNVPYYRRFGFEVVSEIKVPNGPTIWPMWREPR